MDTITLRPSSFVLVCAMVVCVLALAGCPTPLTAPAKVTMVLQGGLASDTGAKAYLKDEVSQDAIAAVYVVVDEIRLQTPDGGAATIFFGPFEVDILSLQGIGAVMATATIPAGSYTGGVMVLSKAEVEFKSEPGVRVPVTLPDGGQFAFEDELVLGAEEHGCLKLHLDDIEIFQVEDDSLQFSSKFEFEVEIEEPVEEPTNGGGARPPLQLGTVEASGSVSSLGVEGAEFELTLGDGSVLGVDSSAASVWLPVAVEGGDPVAGTAADLAELACVRVSGELVLHGGTLRLIASAVEVIAFDCAGE